MSCQAKQTEHTGSKMGHRAFWGRKADAKHENNRRRRMLDRKIALDQSEPHEPPHHPSDLERALATDTIP